ncbi:hypothetical protein MBLNU230_g2094t1 [Neophaeotheca triangularis]
MDTLNTLAGVQETSNDAVTQPPQPISSSAQEVDLEAQDQSLSQRPSRASLPINRQPSNKSLRSYRSDHHLPTDYPASPALPAEHQQPAQSHNGDDASVHTSASEGFAWGPSHPCFPHPNPHCLPTSDEYQRTRVIRVRRDWLQAGDLYPQYANLYPEILDPYVSDAEFRSLVSTLNTLLKDAFDPFTGRAWLDSVLGVATGFLWDDVGLTGVKVGNKKVERYLETWNAGKEREGVDIRVAQLRRTGFMALDFVIPDPGIDEEQGEEDEDGDVGGIGPAE